jgi:Cysteine-rich secretory protein family
MRLLAKRTMLLLFASTALASVSTAIVTQTAAPMPTSTSYTSDQGFQNDMLAATNFYRSEHGVAALTWNTTSAKYALNWSSKCNFAHSVSLLSFPHTPRPSSHRDARGSRYHRAGKPARTLQQATQMPVPRSMHGVWSERSIIGASRGSARRRDTSRRWSGAILRVLAVAEQIAQTRIVSAHSR